jgi:hypothetical protein
MSDPIVKATHGSPDRPLRIGDIEIQCYVLEDGRRVLHKSAMIDALDMKQGSNPVHGSDRLSNFTAGKALSPYISDDLRQTIAHPIKFRTPRGSTAYGYNAAILADICEAVLQARDNGRLQKQQEHIVQRCEVLIRGFARVGIIALVDEATGYQDERDRNELNKILEAYISKELLPWTRRFPPDFYEHLFRLKGWNYPTTKRPRVVGTLTNQLVYDKMPPGVLDELKRRNPPSEKDGRRKYKHHQFLTSDIGHPHLRDHLLEVITLMKVSSTWRDFMRLFNRAFPKTDMLQAELPFPEENE